MRFPAYRQLDSMDCGSTCLRIVSKYYGKFYSAATMRERCVTTREGVSLLGISDAAESIGFRTISVKLTFRQLCDEVPLPCIVHWNQRHFVVVYKIRKGKVYVSDPAAGLLVYDAGKFCKSWLSTENGENTPCGIALLLEPTPAFYDEQDEHDTPRVGWRFMLRYLKPHTRYIVQLLLGMLLGSVLSLILPFITQEMVDTGIGTHNLHFVVVLLIAQVALVVGQTANSLIRSWLMLHISTRVSVSLITDFLAKLMRLPIAFFDSKKLGDILQRIGDHSRIQSFLTGSLLSIVVAVVTFLVYGCIMAGYNWKILAIFLVGSALYVAWVLLFLRQRKKLDYMRFQEAANNQSNLVQLVSGMQDIKLNHCEKQKRWEFERIQARLFKINIRGLSLGQAQQVGGLFIEQTKNVLISFIAAASVINGDITLGMMTAVQYIIGQLNAPISQFITFVQDTQDAKISLERLGEIHSKADEEPVGLHKRTDIPCDADIVLRNVSFQYEGVHSEKVLNGISLTIPHNRITAIVGSSGSGKTTLLKLLLGFYPPVEGEVLLGDIPLSQLSDSAWRSRCGVVMQEGFIFSDTIENNIAVSDEIPDRPRVEQAAQIANIADWIRALPLGYNTRIGMDGHGLSTGQKQRLLIARAAYRNAPYLLFDEATNSLDANNERVIMDNLGRLFCGKTVVIVAHRLSTVRNADNIVVLDHGRIVESGRHADLVARHGYYYRLVKNQLELGT